MLFTASVRFATQAAQLQLCSRVKMDNRLCVGNSVKFGNQCTAWCIVPTTGWRWPQGPQTMERQQRQGHPGCSWPCTRPCRLGLSASCWCVGSASGVCRPTWPPVPMPSSGPGTSTPSAPRCSQHLPLTGILSLQCVSGECVCTSWIESSAG